MSIQKITFKGVLDFLATKESPVWNIHLQASQFELNGFKDSANNGLLCLNFGPFATRNMELHDDCVTFNTRKHGVEQFMSVPYSAIMFIQDPDNGNVMMPWPYYLDHGDDFYAPDESDIVEGPRETFTVDLKLGDNVVTLKVPNRKAWDKANEIAEKNYLDVPEFKTHSDGAKVIDLIDFKNRVTPDQVTKDLQELGLIDERGHLDVYALAGKSQRLPVKAKSETPLTLEEKVANRKWVVIEGGKEGEPKASMPFIDEVHRAKREKREREAKFAQVVNPDIVETQNALRSDGSDGKSIYFPDLDVSKCYFPTKRIERPSWMTVIQGGKALTA